MEKNEILRMVGDATSAMIVHGELRQIEAFAETNYVPIDFFQTLVYKELGFTVQPEESDFDYRVPFQTALMPDGWQRRIDKDLDWAIELVDAKGRVRGRIKYKPWEHAYTIFISRYDIKDHPDPETSKSAVRMIVWDNEMQSIIRDGGCIDKGDYFKSRRAATKQLQAFTEERFPGWESPTAYWS